MKLVCGFLVVIIHSAFSIAIIEKTSKIECETVTNYHWIDVGDRKSCFMNETTEIDSNRFTIVAPRDSTIEGLYFHKNKRIFYLPVNVHQKFPELEVLTASYCSVKQISKNNFKNLKELKFLWLESNQIKTIPRDTFEDLQSLQKLELGMCNKLIKNISLAENIYRFSCFLSSSQIANNQISLMSGETFKHVNSFARIYLGGNVCIDAKFDDPWEIAELANEVSARCGHPKITTPSTDTFLGQAIADNGNLKKENAELLGLQPTHQAAEDLIQENTKLLQASMEEDLIESYFIDDFVTSDNDDELSYFDLYT